TGADGPMEHPRGAHEAPTRHPPKVVSSPAAPVITSRKRSYRVWPHRRAVAEREEIGETQILAALLGVAEMVGGVSDIDELVALIARVTPGHRCRRRLRPFQIGRAHVGTPVTWPSRMPSSA